ncbi:MAG: MBL fold metallo-hydrolase [Candidatus Lokiarchaeota archaeon]|nr:MBL fold metallo-hydrolase [Candidatus Lokiarchaeota archaeon]
MPWILNEGKFNNNTYLFDSFLCDAEYSMSYYVLQGTKKRALIDTSGPIEAERFAKRLKNLNLIPDILILTHSHWDHAGGTTVFQKRFPNIEVFAAKPAIESLKNNSKYNEGFSEVITDLEPVENITPVKERDTIDLGGMELLIYETPGHTNCSISILDQKNMILYLGDALGNLWEKFISPPIMPPEFSQEKLLSTFNKVKNIDYSVIAFSHYGLLTEDSAKILPTYAKFCYIFWRDYFISLLEKNHRTEDVVNSFIDRLHELDSFYPEGKITYKMLVEWIIKGLKSAGLI